MMYIVVKKSLPRRGCVEAWSVVVPWAGFPLAALMDLVGVTSDAKYVVFETFDDPSVSTTQRSFPPPSFPWPYTEAITAEEGRNELTFLAIGAYQERLPPQKGAPIRLVLPWKYGFKSIKSIKRISFIRSSTSSTSPGSSGGGGGGGGVSTSSTGGGGGGEKKPGTFWSVMNDAEYGFYANVNPAVPHPRWSQARERPLTTTSASFDLVDTLLYNGYEREVGYLYENVTVSNSRELWM